MLWVTLCISSGVARPSGSCASAGLQSVDPYCSPSYSRPWRCSPPVVPHTVFFRLLRQRKYGPALMLTFQVGRFRVNVCMRRVACISVSCCHLGSRVTMALGTLSAPTLARPIIRPVVPSTGNLASVVPVLPKPLLLGIAAFE